MGGISAIAISHFHCYSSMVEWSRAFGNVPIYLHASDRQWAMRPDNSVVFWDGEIRELLEGLTLIRWGGHFDGGTVLHWASGAGGKGALLTGDILQVVQDRRHVSFMYSYRKTDFPSQAITHFWRRTPSPDAITARTLPIPSVLRFSPILRFSCELFPAAAHPRGNGDGVHRHRPTVSGRNNFTGHADYDVFTADVRLQTERYKAVLHTGEPLRHATRVSPGAAILCRTVFRQSDRKQFETGEYRFAKRRIPVSPALVTSALSLSKLIKARCHAKDTGLLLFLGW